MNCKTIILSGPREGGFCIMESELPEVLKGVYKIPTADILIDSSSYSTFKNPKYAGYVAIPVPNEDIYKLHPVYERDLQRYKNKEIGVFDIEAKLKPSRILGTGSFGQVIYHSTEKVAEKASLSEKGVIPADFVKEVAFYNIIDGCVPDFYHYEANTEEKKGRFSIYMEAGVRTLEDLIPDLEIEKDIIFIKHELVTCLAGINTQGIIHCDLKPANAILINNKIKIIDWGMYQIDYTPDFSKQKSTNIQTMTYRAPEIALENLFLKKTSAYSYKVDVFSLGLIYLAINIKNSMFLQNIMYDINDMLELDKSSTFTLNKAWIGTLLYTFVGDFYKKSLSEFCRMVNTYSKGNNYFKEYFIGDRTEDIYNHIVEKFNINDKSARMISKMLNLDPMYRSTYKEIIDNDMFADLDNPDFDKIPRYWSENPIIPDINQMWESKGIRRGTRMDIIEKLFNMDDLTLELKCSSIQLLDFVMYYMSEPYMAKMISKKNDIDYYLKTLTLACIALSFSLYEKKVDIDGEDLQEFVFRVMDGNILIPSWYSYLVQYSKFVSKERLLLTYLDNDVYSEKMADRIQKIP